MKVGRKIRITKIYKKKIFFLFSLIKMVYNKKRKNLDINAQIDHLKEFKGEYKDIIPNIERIGYQLDQGPDYASGGLAIGHTGPFNSLGKSNGRADKAAQLHDIGYGVLGSNAYFNYNEADEKYLNDLKDVNNLTSLIGKSYFNIKKVIAPNMAGGPMKRPNLESTEHRSAPYLTPPATPMKNNNIGISAELQQQLEMDVDDATQNASTIAAATKTLGVQASRGLNTMVHTAAEQIPINTQTIKISNTYKVYLSNEADVTVNTDNLYKYYQYSGDVSGDLVSFKRDVSLLPIYGYNRKVSCFSASDPTKSGCTIYTPLTWKLLPTLKNENYITPSDWDNIMRMGFTKLKVLKRKVKLAGLYQLHNYITTETGEVQVQGNPYIEICQPKGQFFKHEHYPIFNGFAALADNNINYDPSGTKNKEPNVVIMNAVKGFVSGDPRDCAAHGFKNNSILDVLGTPSTAKNAFDGYENTLQPYFYPCYTGANITSLAAHLSAAVDYWTQWYPDLSRTQDVRITDNLDGTEFDVPVDDTTSEEGQRNAAVSAGPSRKPTLSGPPAMVETSSVSRFTARMQELDESHT
jgi:hypothetical protein